ncbi:TATA box-binding 1 [Solea senegalensis]|uniref:TATA box-binding 1 n=1 Tax=Solea senegalensis TaxID=28829 RepID=A0AAV6QPG7_SOLSE|nr:TATA box-binding protein-like 1 [Solea senegalensis]KAG7494915.1 TATA box-binding 1 [Solea senegalensis]
MDSSCNPKITITNVVATFKTKCPLNMHFIASKGHNVIFQQQRGKVMMKLRKPMITATISPSGGIACAGAKSEADAKMGARRVARYLQKLGYKVKFSHFRVVNVLAVYSFPFHICLTRLVTENKLSVTYEPELFPAAATYRVTNPKATLQVYFTGKIIVAGPNVRDVTTGFKQGYPLLLKYKTNSVEQKKMTKPDTKTRKRTDDILTVSDTEIQGEQAEKRRWLLMQYNGNQPGQQFLVRIGGKIFSVPRWLLDRWGWRVMQPNE